MPTKFEVQHQVELTLTFTTTVDNGRAKKLCENHRDPEIDWKEEAEECIQYLFDDLSDELQEHLAHQIPDTYKFVNGLEMRLAYQEASVLDTEVSPN